MSNKKNCLICKSAGRNPSTHNTNECWFVSKFEKLQLSKALRVETDDIAGDIEDVEFEAHDHNVEFVENCHVETEVEVRIALMGKVP